MGAVGSVTGNINSVSAPLQNITGGSHKPRPRYSQTPMSGGDGCYFHRTKRVVPPLSKLDHRMMKITVDEFGQPLRGYNRDVLLEIFVGVNIKMVPGPVGHQKRGNLG